MIFAFGCYALPLHAGTPAELAQGEIDRSVWRPFKCAFEAMDGRALNALYANRVLRVTPEGMDTQSSFKSINETRFDESRRNGDRIVLEFWFDSRASDPATSYDVGFYRLGTTDTAGVTRYHHGQFHIVLRKQQGHWKIVQDWDTDRIAGRLISAEDFALGSPLEIACP